MQATRDARFQLRRSERGAVWMRLRIRWLLDRWERSRLVRLLTAILSSQAICRPPSSLRYDRRGGAKSAHRRRRRRSLSFDSGGLDQYAMHRGEAQAGCVSHSVDHVSSHCRSAPLIAQTVTTTEDAFAELVKSVVRLRRRAGVRTFNSLWAHILVIAGLRPV